MRDFYSEIMTLRDIKNKIGSLKTIQKTTNVMKVISSVKMNKFRGMLDFSLEPLQVAQRILINLLKKTEKIPILFDLKKKNLGKKTALVIFSSDRGLCSNFNTLVSKKFVQILQKNDFSADNLEIFAIGKHFGEFCSKKFADFNLQKYLSADFAAIENINQFSANIIKRFSNGEFDKIFILHFDFQNLLLQDLQFSQFLPFYFQFDNKIHQKPLESDDNPRRALDFFAQEFLKIQFYNWWIAHVTAENCFRMKAMESATTNTKNMISEKELIYNRARQASITKDLIEIISGAESQNAG